MLTQSIVGPQRGQTGDIKVIRVGKDVDHIVSEYQPRYYSQVLDGRVYTCTAVSTSTIIYTTAAGTGGPLLWNNSSTYNAVIMGAMIDVTTASGVAGSIGITGGFQGTTAPSSTTAIDAGPKNLLLGGPASQTTQYRKGTVANAGGFYIPLFTVSTAATSIQSGWNYVDIGGLVVVPPQYYAAITASATLTSSVNNIALVWAEVPV